MLVFCCWRWTPRVLPAGHVFSTRLTGGVGSARETSVLVLFRTRGCKWQSQLQLAEDWREFTVSCPQSAGRLAVTQPWGQLDARTASSTSCFWCLSLLASSCLTRFYHHKSRGSPQVCIIRKGLNVTIPVPKPRNPRQDWGRHSPCSPREQEPEEGSRAPWTPRSEWQENPSCRSGIVGARCRHLVPSCSEEGPTLCGPQSLIWCLEA